MGNEARLEINPVTRKISTKDEKIRLVQYDNNSVRIYFEIPRSVINHEMLDSSTVEVHFDNISSDRKQKNSDIYKVTDITVDPQDNNKVIFSWLVGKTATQLVGSVEIALHFGRTDDPEYAWHTTNYSGINVFEGKHNETPVVDMYPDAFYELKRELEQKIEDAVEEIEPVELAQDLEGNATDKAVSQAAVNAHKTQNDAYVNFLMDKVAEHETALGDKVDKATLYEDYITPNILDPDNAESGYIDTTNGALMDSSNHFRTSTPISVEGHTGYIHIRTRLPNDYTYQDRLICVLTYDGDGNVLGGATKKVSSQDENGDILFTLRAGTTHINVWIDSTQSGVSFEDWCISFDEIDHFVSFGSGTKVNENDIIITKHPTKSYEPASKGYVDETKVEKLEGSFLVYTSMRGEVYGRQMSTTGVVGSIVQYDADNDKGNKNEGGFLNTAVPTKPYHAANKRYVDNKINDLSTSLANLQEAAIGTLYTTVEYSQSGGTSVTIPPNALRYIYVESLGDATFLNSNGEAILTQPVDALSVNENVFVQRPHVPCLVQLPEGAEFIDCTVYSGVPDGTEYTSVEGLKIIFQVKVGG